MNDNITKFSSGAIRDITVGKSAMELIPYELLTDDITLNLLREQEINNEVKRQYLNHIFDDLSKLRLGDIEVVDDLIYYSFKIVGKPFIDTLYNLGIHYGAGAEKYGANNFMLGQRLSHIVGSYTRHLVKFVEGWKDEAPHERGMLWNALNIKFVITYYKDNKDICDMLYWYKDSKPNIEFIKDKKE